MLRTSLLAVLLLCASAPLFAQSAPISWIVSSLTRVAPADPPRLVSPIEIAGAKGESESFQIIVRAPEGGLSNVNVTLSDLRSSTGESIPATAFTLFREHYVYVSSSSPNWGGSNRPGPAGWYPDGLIPFNDPASGLPLSGAQIDAVPFNLPTGRNQPIWVDLVIPRTAAAGRYSATYTVTSDQGQSQGEVSLRVYNFTLPVRPSLRSSFLLRQDTSLGASEELLRNKVEPLRVDPAYQRNLIDQSGLGGVGLPFWSGADIHTCSMSAAPSPEAFQSSANLQQPDLWKYVYSADEIDRCPNLFETVKAWGRSMHQAGVSNLVTMSPDPALYDDGSGTGRSAVDVWVQLPVMYDRTAARVAEVLRKGDQVWSYNTLVQDSYSPKWLIDFSPLDFRVQPGFINQSLGLTGLLYWRADLWSADPWNVVNSWGNGNYPGEGLLLYPGAQIGTQSPAPSMRLKWIRDGVEDFEYIQILRSLGQEASALQISRSVGADWTNWTRDAAVLEAGRQQLAALIEQATALAPPPAPTPTEPPPPAAPAPTAPPANSAPTADSVVPNGIASALVTFLFAYSDADGASDLNSMAALINSSFNGNQACWIVYDRAARRLWLADDSANTWQSAALSDTRRIENSQCFIYPVLIQEMVQGNSATLSVPIEFKPAFSGAKQIFLQAVDKAGSSSEYQRRGNWIVP